mgnify:CR=1 FL=1
MEIPYGKHNISDQDIDAVVKVLKSNFITQGPEALKFEKSLCAYTGAKYCSVVNSATSALHLTLLAVGVSEGDSVWVPAISFVATANAAKMCGAKVDFIDINPETINICVSSLKKALLTAEQKPKVLVVVHMAGLSCEMKSISEICEQYGIIIIEDASHAIGGEFNSKKVGCCQYSKASIFSFHPVKIITSGEGGAIMTNDKKVKKNIDLLRSHGVNKDLSLEEPWLYDQDKLGFNFRMNDIQAALGNSQLKRVDRITERRNKIASIYKKNMSPKKFIFQKVDESCFSSYHLFIVQYRSKIPTKVRAGIHRRMIEKNILVNVHYRPIYKNTFYNLNVKEKNFPGAELYYSRCITLPLYPELRKNEIETIAKTLSYLLCDSTQSL